MAINFPNGFNITSQEAIDSRLVMTKSQMLNVIESRLPDVYFTVCKDDGKMYLYNVNNTANEETGKFKPISSEIKISTDKDNILQLTPNGLKVVQSSIDDSTINNLFNEEE